MTDSKSQSDFKFVPVGFCRIIFKLDKSRQDICILSHIGKCHHDNNEGYYFIHSSHSPFDIKLKNMVKFNIPIIGPSTKLSNCHVK